MSLNQINEDFNDVFEIYFPQLPFFKRRILNLLTRGLLGGLKLRRILFGGSVLANERIVEYPTVFRWIKPEGLVLDIGCVSSRLPMQLASLGYRAYGLDTRIYPFKHPNFTFIREDIFSWKPELRFDIVLLVSTVEHVGLEIYGDLNLGDDKNAVRRIRKWMAEDGQLIVSVPFGKAGLTRKHRIYDTEKLADLFSDFSWINQKYYIRSKGSWLPCTAEELKDISSPELPPNGSAILDLRKREKLKPKK